MAAPASPSETLYLWQGTDRRGKRTQGELVCANLVLAKAQLRRQGILLRRIRRKPIERGGWLRSGIRTADITLFSRQLATMLKAGIPLLQSFNIVAEGLDNSAMVALVRGLRDDVAIGNTLAGSLRKHPRYFDGLFCNLIESGEQSGSLESMLDQVATGREKTEILKNKIGKALHYPLAVMMVAIVVTTILLLKVVPQFASTFASFGADLPAFTRFVLQLSDLAIAHWWQMPLFMLGVWVALREGRRRSPALVNMLDKSLLRLPLIGSITAKSCYARFTRMLALTYAAGLPLVEALDSAAGATGNTVYQNAAGDIRDRVSDGQPLHVAIRSTGLFPSMITQMVSIGEESGTLDAMLEKCATRYETEVDNSVDGLTALFEPLIMAILGTLIGGLMIAMYLPIFQLGQVI